MELNVLKYFPMVGAACRLNQKWGVYVSNGLEYDGDQSDHQILEFVVNQATPLFDGITAIELRTHLISNDPLYLFESEGDARSFYNIFEQVPVCSSAIYACLFDHTGSCLTENT